MKLKIKKIPERKLDVKKSLKKAQELIEKGDLRSSSKELRDVLRKFPMHKDALKLSFDIYLKLEDWQAALGSINKLVEIDPSTDNHINKGCIHIALGQYENALKSFSSVKADTKNPLLLINQGIAYRGLYRYIEAIQCLSTAKDLTPHDPYAAMHLGIVYYELNQFDTAIQEYVDALKIDSNSADVRWNLSLALLAKGDYKNGWRQHEWRFNQKFQILQCNVSTTAPRWDLKTIKPGMRLLVEQEQGIGDFIQFTRFIKPLAEKGVSIILSSSKDLYHLAQQVEGVDEVYVPNLFPTPSVDYYCHLCSLPLALGITLDNMPGPTELFLPPIEKTNYWSNKLKGTRPKVGVVWSGNPNFTLDSRRSIPFDEFVKSLPDGIDYYCLSKELNPKDQFLCAGQSKIKYIGNEIVDWLDTEAIINEMDLVIGVSTSVPTLSASMGKETWLLLSYSADWRWLFGREDSPWFPSMKIYRQNVPNNWTTILEKVKKDLTERFLDSTIDT